MGASTLFLTCVLVAAAMETGLSMKETEAGDCTSATGNPAECSGIPDERELARTALQQRIADQVKRRSVAFGQRAEQIENSAWASSANSPRPQAEGDHRAGKSDEGDPAAPAAGGTGGSPAEGVPKAEGSGREEVRMGVEELMEEVRRATREARERQAHAGVAPQKQRVTVTIPEGMKGGEKLVVKVEGSREYEVRVPAHMKGGDTLHLDIEYKVSPLAPAHPAAPAWSAQLEGLGRAGDVVGLTEAMAALAPDPLAQAEACHMMAQLTSVSSANRLALFEAGALHAATAALLRHPGALATVQACAGLVGSLLEEAPPARAAPSLGTPHALTHALHATGEAVGLSAAASQSVLAAMLAVARTPEGLQAWPRPALIRAVLHAMARHEGDAGVLAEGCRVLFRAVHASPEAQQTLREHAERSPLNLQQVHGAWKKAGGGLGADPCALLLHTAQEPHNNL